MKKSVGAIFFGRIISASLLFVFNFYVAESEGVKILGDIALHFSIVSIIALLIAVGVNKKIVEIFHGGGDLEGYLKKIIIYRLTVGIFVVVLLLVFRLLTDYNYNIELIGVAGALFGISEIISYYVVIKKKYNKYFLISVIKNLSIWVFWIFGKSAPEKTEWFVVVLLLASLVQLSFASLFSKILFVTKASKTESNGMKYNPYVLNDAVVACLANVEIWVISWMAGMDYVDKNAPGFYAFSLNVAYVIPVLSSSIISYFSTQKYEKSSKIRYNAMYSTKITGVIAILYLIVSLVILKSFKPDIYGNIYLLLFFILLGTVVSSYFNIIQLDLIKRAKSNFIVKLSTSQLVFSVLVCLLLVYFWGALGAAISMVLTRVYGLLVQELFLNKTRK